MSRKMMVQTAILVSALLSVTSVSRALAAPKIAAKSNHKSALNLSADERLLQSVDDLCQRAAVIYNLAHEHKPAANDIADGAETTRLILNLGAREWTKQKIQQTFVLTGFKDPSFRSILTAYVDELPLDGQPDPTSDLAKTTVHKLAAINAEHKSSFENLMKPAFGLTRAAVIELKKPKIAAADLTVPPPEKRINAGAYYDDVDGMFDDARAKINSTFDKFSQSLDQTGVSSKLVHTSVDGQDMSVTMKQASSNALIQAGSTASRSYKPLLNQLETLHQPAK